MQAIKKRVPSVIREDKIIPASLFKNSLRAWQARYNVRLAALKPVAAKADNQTEHT